MRKKFKIFTLLLCIGIFIITIHSLFTFIFIPNMQKEKVLKSFTKERDKFESIHNYIVNTHPFLQCRKNQDGKIEIYSIEFDKNGEPNKVEIQIEDTTVLENINYILNNLDFEYIENIKYDTHFVFRDVKGHFQSIDYTTQDITKFSNWKCINLEGNWYYRSIWTYLRKDREEDDFTYLLRLAFHIVRGY